jgi:hypothetical protein
MCQRTGQPQLLPKVYIIVGAAAALARTAAAPPTPGPAEGGPAPGGPAKEGAMVGDGGHDPVEAVRRAIDRYGLGGADFAEARFDRPRIVRYLDDDDDTYYLVPLRWPDASVLVGRVNAHRLTYLGAQLRPPKEIRTDAHYRLAEPAEVEDWIHQGRYTFGGHGDAEYHVRDDLVWRPCQESRSPYYPFYQVTLNGEPVGFVGLDRTPYSKLNDLVGG